MAKYYGYGYENANYVGVVEITQTSQSVSGNYSDLSWTFSVYHKNNASTYNRSYGNNFSFTADGSSRGASYTAGTVAVAGHGSESNALLLSRGSFRVYHNSDGTKTFSFTASYWNTDSSSIGSSAHPLSVSGTFACTTIPRTSSVSANNTALGTATTISIGSASSGFTHDLSYSLGGASGTIASNVATSCSWTPPLGLAANMPNAASGTCTITCKTKNGSTVIGTSTTNITLSIPTSSVSAVSGNMGVAKTLSINRATSDLTHTITYTFGSATGTIATKTTSTSISWTPDTATFAPQVTDAKTRVGTLTITTYNGTATVGSRTATLSLTVPSSEGPTLTATATPSGTFASYDLFVQGQSALISFADSANYGATIASRTVNGNAVSGTTYSAPLPNSGSITFTCVSTDSRGYQASTTVSIANVEPYSTPSIPDNYTITRCLSDGTEKDSGTYIKVLCNESHSSVGGYNTVTMAVAYGQTGTSYGADQSISPGVAAIIGGGLIAVTNSYDVRVTLTDAAGAAYVLHVVVPMEAVTVHLRPGGKAVGVGRYADSDSLLAVNEEWDVLSGRLRPTDYAPQYTTIEANANLNDITYCGYYRCADDSAIPTLSNCPTAEKFTLRVYDGAGGSRRETAATWKYPAQEVKNISGVTYIRTGSTGSGTTITWGAWQTITQSTTSANGNDSGYFVFTNGIAMCWQQIPLGGINTTSAWGSMYESSYINLGNRPYTFASTPMTTATVAGSWGLIIEHIRNDSPSSWGQVAFCRPTSASNASCTLMLFAVGKAS